MAEPDIPLLGIDLGAAQVKVAILDGRGHILGKACSPARANPVNTLAKLLRGGLPPDAMVRAGVTGAGGAAWADSIGCVLVNEITATARWIRSTLPSARSVIELGGQSSKWILLGESEQEIFSDFSINGLCAAGAGVFLEQQAARLGLRVEALGDIAAASPRGATVAGRCSVFAKSDMIHLQQKGTPQEEIAYGLCQALVRTFASSVLQGRRLERPVVLAGGGAANRGLVRALREHLHFSDSDLLVADDAAWCGAAGAALDAAGAAPIGLDALLAALERASIDRQWTSTLTPLRGGDPASEAVENEEPAAEGLVEAFLGFDVGSVSTDLVVLDRQFRLLQGIYLPTRGRPLEALREGLDRVHRRFGDRIVVLAAGATGSGRHLAAKLLGADVIRNEITAQMVSSAHYHPDVETIFEIGGQDSKFISVRNGILADFEMNKICSGGTGSFLEEQAERLGVRIGGDFSQRAFLAEKPCDLGSRCTVFMDSSWCGRRNAASGSKICARGWPTRSPATIWRKLSPGGPSGGWSCCRGELPPTRQSWRLSASCWDARSWCIPTTACPARSAWRCWRRGRCRRAAASRGSAPVPRPLSGASSAGTATTAARSTASRPAREWSTSATSASVTRSATRKRRRGRVRFPNSSPNGTGCWITTSTPRGGNP